MNKEKGFTWKLGMFVIAGLVIFAVAIYFVGKQKNLFGSTFRLRVMFRTVSGLKVGNNVRFSGINVGTVDEIELVSDSTVMVDLVMKSNVKKFIKTDATASIGSDGLMGDKVLTISQGTVNGMEVKDNDLVSSKAAIEMEDIMGSVKKSVDNAGLITAQLAEFTFKMNNGNGALSRLMTDPQFSGSLKTTLMNLEKSSNQFAAFTYKMNNGKGGLSKLVSDEKFGKSIDSTMANIQSATKGLSENMEAVQSNFLLKGFFKKKKKAEAKKQAALKKQQALDAKKKPVTVPKNAKDSL